jgi:ABC-2 type transport system ATP-binding protein
VIVSHGRLVTQSSLAALSQHVTPTVRVRTPQAAELRSALTANGITTEPVDDETLHVLDSTTESVGRIAASGGIVIYEIAAERFDLEELFLDLTTSKGAVR